MTGNYVVEICFRRYANRENDQKKKSDQLPYGRVLDQCLETSVATITRRMSAKVRHINRKAKEKEGLGTIPAFRLIRSQIFDHGEQDLGYFF